MPLFYFTVPYRLLKPCLFQRAVHARNSHAIKVRSALAGMKSVDIQVYESAIKKQEDPQHVRI
eukprot:3850534-Karenia_brevis.AAC.1